MNRGNNKERIFHKAGDYQAFLAVVAEAVERFGVELFCWCLMPNHWHLVIRPGRTAKLAEFMRWLTVTHVRRHHEHYQGQSGHLYQGRYKGFPVEDDNYFLTLGRYVEGNALKAKLVVRAEQWEWSSLSQRLRRGKQPPLAEWPVDRPSDWTDLVNEMLTVEQEQAIATSLARQRPLGSPAWIKRISTRLGLAQTTVSRGRPVKAIAQLSPRQQRRRRASLATPETP
jgi:putative transposase